MVSSSRVFRIAALALRCCWAVFVYAAWAKLRQPWELFAMSSTPTRCCLLGRSGGGAHAAVGRMLIGLALMAGAGREFRRRGLVLLMVFFALMVRAYAKRMQIDCGCFGLGIRSRPVRWLGWSVAGGLPVSDLDEFPRPPKPA